MHREMCLLSICVHTVHIESLCAHRYTSAYVHSGICTERCAYSLYVHTVHIESLCAHRYLVHICTLVYAQRDVLTLYMCILECI